MIVWLLYRSETTKLMTYLAVSSCSNLLNNKRELTVSTSPSKRKMHPKSLVTAQLNLKQLEMLHCVIRFLNGLHL